MNISYKDQAQRNYLRDKRHAYMIAAKNCRQKARLTTDADKRLWYINTMELNIAYAKLNSAKLREYWQ